MKVRSPVIIISSLLVAMMAVSPALAKKDLPAVNDEGMELVKDTKMSTIYADPGANLGVYNRIWLEDASVAFKKNWQRDQNRSRRSTLNRVKDNDVERDVVFYRSETTHCHNRRRSRTAVATGPCCAA